MSDTENNTLFGIVKNNFLAAALGFCSCAFLVWTAAQSEVGQRIISYTMKIENGFEEAEKKKLVEEINLLNSSMNSAKNDAQVCHLLLSNSKADALKNDQERSNLQNVVNDYNRVSSDLKICIKQLEDIKYNESNIHKLTKGMSLRFYDEIDVQVPSIVGRLSENVTVYYCQVRATNTPEQYMSSGDEVDIFIQKNKYRLSVREARHTACSITLKKIY